MADLAVMLANSHAYWYVGYMARKRVKRWVEGGPLPRWMRLYVLWVTSKGGELSGTKAEYRGRFPTSSERVVKASELAGRPVQSQLVTLMEKRKDVREYYESVNADSQFHAKELSRLAVAKNFEARAQGLDWALEAQDHKVIEHYTRPFVDHGIGKKGEGDKAPRKIVINLVGMPVEEKKMLLKAASGQDEDDVIDYEVVETKRITDGSEDD